MSKSQENYKYVKVKNKLKLFIKSNFTSYAKNLKYSINLNVSYYFIPLSWLVVTRLEWVMFQSWSWTKMLISAAFENCEFIKSCVRKTCLTPFHERKFNYLTTLVKETDWSIDAWRKKLVEISETFIKALWFVVLLIF